MKDCPTLFALSLPRIYLQIFAASLAFVSILVFTANITLLRLLRRSKQMNSITSKLVILLTISDIGAGFLSYPCIIAVYTIPHDSRSCQFELAAQFIALFFGYFSFCVLMGIAIDRYIHVTKLQHYNRYMNEFTMKLMVLFSVIASAAISAISTVYSTSFFVRLAISSCNAISLSSVCIFYLRVERRIRIHAENAEKTLAQRRGKTQLMESIKTVRILLCVLVVIYLPYTITSCVWAYYKMERNTNPGFLLDILKTISYLITFSNAWINALVYCYGNKTLWSYMKKKNAIESGNNIETCS